MLAPLVALALLGQPDGAAKVSFITGSAAVAVGAKTTPLTLGASVPEGATIRTEKGARVEISFADGSRFRVASESEAIIAGAKLVGKKRESISLKLIAGRAWANVAKKTGGGDAFEVTTTNATAGVRGTSFAVLASGDASALVRVYSGTVGVKPSAATKIGDRKVVSGPREIDKKQWEEIIATAMKEVRVSASGELSPAQDFEDSGESLEWAQWNQARDAGK